MEQLHWLIVAYQVTLQSQILPKLLKVPSVTPVSQQYEITSWLMTYEHNKKQTYIEVVKFYTVSFLKGQPPF